MDHKEDLEALEAEQDPDPHAEGEAEVEGDGWWLDAAVAEALEWEVMPGTSPAEGWEETRGPELRAFFEAHPEYADSEKRALLSDIACAMGTEEGHARLEKPTPPAPTVVEVPAGDWRVVVAYSRVWCTSDDWSAFTNEVGNSVGAAGITFGYAGAESNEIVVQRAGEELGRHALEGQGYLLWKSGGAPVVVDHDLVDSVLAQASEHFGVAIANVGSGE